jgi:hypothetical protein
MRPRDDIPERMRHLPCDKRGYPIFFGAYIDPVDGTPHFTINDEEKRQRVIDEDLCSICGRKLLRGRWFVGGPMSAFHPRGAYIDMPMHDECVHYALEICPYIAMPSWSRTVSEQKLKQVNAGLVAIDPTMIPDRPAVFVAVMTVGQRMTGGNGIQRYVVPRRPYRKIEYWRHGQRLSDAEGWLLVVQHFPEITTPK